MASPTKPKAPRVRRLLRLSAVLLSITTTAWVTTADAAEPAVRRRVDPAERRIETSHAKPVQRTSSHSTAPQHTNKKRVVGSEKQASLISQAAYGHVITEPMPRMMMNVDAGCGFEPGCGVDPVCGIEPGCGYDPVCGVEVGCGLEACDCCDTAPGCDGYGPMACDSSGDFCAPAGIHGECIPLIVPVTRINWSQFELFAGVQAFSAPPNYQGPANAPGLDARDNDGTSSFGLNEGFNWSRPFAIFGGGINSQFGLRATQTNASGAEFTSDNRRQVFLTAGLYRRVDYGLQGGVVFDYLYDDWNYSVHLTQLRGEIGWTFDCNTFAYGFVAGMSGDESNAIVLDNDGVPSTVTVNFEASDQHRFIYRREFRQIGIAEMFAGFTEDSDGLLGASLRVPVLRDLAINTGFTYLNPDWTTGQRDNQEESWNVGFGFVWFPRGGCQRSRYDRPLFEVADNGNFLIDRR
jgi:hypothetical protein